MSDQGRLVAGRYRLAESIGRGGMGTVWRAEDELLGRQVAVKKLRVPPQLHDDERERLYERTRREARSAARINHPNVVVVHDVVEDEGLPCVVMEYVRSRTLADVLKKDGTLSPKEAARIGRGMVAALRAAHRAGVLHRDVKPANVLLGLEGQEADDGWPGGRVVLTDFGIATTTGTSTLTRTGELIGSFDYLAPERITGGTPGPASDLWALGATLYQALEGVAPFHRDTPIETAYAIASEPVAAPRRAGPLAPLIESLLAKEPERRMTAEQVERLLVSSVETVVSHGGSDTGTGERQTGSGTAWTGRELQEEPPAPRVPAQGGTNDPGVTGPTMLAPPGRIPPPTGPTTPAGPARPITPTGSDTVPPAPEPYRPHPHRGRRTVVAVVTVALLAALAAGGVLYARHHQGHHTPTGDPSPTVHSSAPVAPPTWPAGFHLVHDPKGFSMAVPDGWTRQTKPNGDVDYVDADAKADLKVSIQDYAGPSPLEHWRELEKVLQADDNGYSLLRMNATTADVGGVAEPAAIWEWTWEGQLRTYHAIDLGFGKEGGTEYAIYLSAPDAQWQQELPAFTVATRTFHPMG